MGAPSSADAARQRRNAIVKPAAAATNAATGSAHTSASVPDAWGTSRIFSSYVRRRSAMISSSLSRPSSTSVVMRLRMLVEARLRDSYTLSPSQMGQARRRSSDSARSAGVATPSVRAAARPTTSTAMNSSASHPGQRFSARLTDDVLTGRTASCMCGRVHVGVGAPVSRRPCSTVRSLEDSLAHWPSRARSAVSAPSSCWSVTGPMARYWTIPSGSTIHVSGTWATPNASEIDPSPS